MHVLYFHQHFSTPKGATGIRSYEMARRLTERGHKVTMVCGSYGQGKSGLTGEPVRGRRTGTVDGIDIIEFSLPYSNNDGFLKRSITFMRFALRSIGIALWSRFDLLFATSTPLTAGIPGIAMRLSGRGKPFVFEVRDLWPELPREMGVITNPLVLWAMSVLEWFSYHTAHGIIGLAPGIEQGIQRRGIKPERTTMIPNGADLNLFQPKTERQAPLDDLKDVPFKAVFTGAHGIANGLDAVLDCAAELKQRGRDDIALAFIGDGKLKAGLIERAEKEGLDNCRFYDPVPKTRLAEMLPHFDAGLMILANIPAFYYGTSPNKFFDYISAGIPVVNNYPGWLADMIGEHGCGVAVPPGHPKLLAEALCDLAENPQKRADMGNAGRKLAEAQFGRALLADRWVDYLERIHEKVT
ncbi:MAG: glycosyltransferase family 4 protein [Acidobacteriota bacterium]|nr:glycosyltransferase family 4 protein [Acidobacteriota bacterium]